MPKLAVYELEASYLPLIDFRRYGLTGAEIDKKLNDRNIFLMNMSTFFAGTNDIKTFFRINLACNR